MLRIFKRKRGPIVRIKKAIPSKLAEGQFVYEIAPAVYTGPTQLEPGTELEVVSAPSGLSFSGLPKASE